MLNIKNTCQGCERRFVGCHATCELYLQAREELEKTRSRVKDVVVPYQFLVERVKNMKKRPSEIVKRGNNSMHYRESKYENNQTEL